MLGFLRKIRKRLLAEQKLRTYLVYAIGEILLIVVGILIALGINNANEQRKDQQVREGYYDQLLLELEQDSILLEEQMLTLQKSIDSYDDYIELFERPNLEIFEVIILLTQVERRVRNRRVIFNTNSIATLEFTGEIKIIPKKIRTKLVEFRRQQEFATSVDNQNDDTYVNGLLEAMQSGFSPLVYRLENQQRLAQYLNLPDKYQEVILMMEAGFAFRNITEL